MALWRIHLRPDAQEHVDPAEFAIQQNILGVGWQLEIIENDLTEADWIDYINLVNNYVQLNDFEGANQWLAGWNTIVVNALHDGMAIDDLCWARDRNAIYYLGRVVGDWEYRSDDNFQAADLVNVRECEWVEIGGVDSIPGKVLNSFIPNRTLQRVWDDSSLVYSKLIYNQMQQEPIYVEPEFEEMNLFSLLDPFNCEDLVAIYLQKCHGYILIPSTCNRKIQNTEFVLKKPNEVAYAQVKQGVINLNRDCFQTDLGIPDKWFLFTTEGNYLGPENERVICLNLEEMEDFAFENVDIMPNKIQRIINFLEERN